MTRCTILIVDEGGEKNGTVLILYLQLTVTRAGLQQISSSGRYMESEWHVLQKIYITKN